MDRGAAAAEFAGRLGHVFASPERLERALTHSSAAHGRLGRPHNETLEFLGDRVLGLLAAEALLEAGPDWREGELTRRHHLLVSGATCARVARGLEIGRALRLDGGAVGQGARSNSRILGDAMEAVLAAVFLDGGLDAARAVFRRAWGDALAQTVAAADRREPKTALQEWATARSLPAPAYAVVDRSGPDHAPQFTVTVRVGDLSPAMGQGASLRTAEKAAASELLAREAGE